MSILFRHPHWILCGFRHPHWILCGLLLVGCQDGMPSSPSAADSRVLPGAKSDGPEAEPGLLSAKVNALFEGANRGDGEPAGVGFAVDGEARAATGMVPGERSGAGAGGDAEPVNSIVGPAQGGEAGRDGSRVDESTPRDSTDRANTADANRLMARLHELHRMQMDVQTMEQFQQIQTERLEAANQLLATGPSYEFQLLGIKSQIDALSWQDGTQQPGAAERLEARCRELMADSNGEFRRQGILGLTGAYLRRLSREPSKGVEDLIRDARSVLTQDYDDFELATELAQAASALFTQGQREAAVAFMKAIRDGLQPSQQVAVIGIRDSLAAQIAMAEVRFDKIMADQVADEARHLPALREAMQRIIASGATVALYNEMTPWMQLFEQQACYQSVDTVAEALEVAYRQLPVQTEIVEVLDALRPIRQRMGLIGQTLNWSELVDFEGKPFDPRILSDKVVLVTFFSAAADKPQRDQLQYETRMYEELQKNGLVMVGFNVDDQPNAAKDFFASRPPRWPCLRAANNAKLGYASDFAQQCVADRTPYRLLLDRQGRVVHVAVPIDRLGRYVTQLLQSNPSP